jgi:short-subunit dehydrogenase
MNIIIGGTHGLGSEIARELQARGEETFVTGRSYKEAEHGPGMAVDLRRLDQVGRLTDYVLNLDDMPLEGFYWVAGYGYNGDFVAQNTPEDNAHDMALANFANVIPIAQAAWQILMSEPEPQNFVVVSSTTGVRARTDEAVYAGTKHAQVGYTRSLGLESERLGKAVRVALFLPGGMKTPFWDRNPPAAYDSFLDPKKVAQRIVERVKAQEEPYYEEMIEKGSL